MEWFLGRRVEQYNDNPNDYYQRFRISNIISTGLLMEEDYQEAIKWFVATYTDYDKLTADEALALPQYLWDSDAQALNGIGACYLGLGDKERARLFFEKVIEINGCSIN